MARYVYLQVNRRVSYLFEMRREFIYMYVWKEEYKVICKKYRRVPLNLSSLRTLFAL